MENYILLFRIPKKKVKDYNVFKLYNGRKEICYIGEVYETKFVLYVQEDITQ